MSFHKLFVMGLVVSGTLALSGAATRAFARGGEGGRSPKKMTTADEAQMRDLLSKLAAASGEPAPEERTEADLMYEAMIRWNGEPPGSAAIDRLLESSKKEAARTKKATVEKVRRMFWKDPFSDSPGKLIPVRQEDRELLASYDRKGQRRGEGRASHEPRDSELARLRAEIDAARAEAAATRAENERLRERTESMSDDRRECVADNDARGEVRMRRRASSSGGGSGRSHHHVSRQQTQVALTSSIPSESRQTPAAPPPTQPIIPATVAPPNHGMIITPLPVTPPPSQPPIENGRRSRSSRPGR